MKILTLVTWIEASLAVVAVILLAVLLIIRDEDYKEPDRKKVLLTIGIGGVISIVLMFAAYYFNMLAATTGHSIVGHVFWAIGTVGTGLIIKKYH